MNWLDILILIAVIIPAISGFKNGFLRKLFGFAGIIAGFILAVKFYIPLSGILTDVFNISIIFSKIMSFLLILLIIYSISIYLAKYMTNLYSATNILNKLAGFFLGAVQGLIVISIILYNFNLLNLPSQESRDESKLYGNVMKVAPYVFDKLVNLLPGNKNIFDEFRSHEEKDTNNRRR